MQTLKNGHPALNHAVKRLESLNIDRFEVYMERSQSVSIDSKDQEIESLTRSEDIGLSFRVIKNKRLGFSYTLSLEENAIDSAIDSAIAVAKVMPEDPLSDFFQFSQGTYPSLDNCDLSGLEVPLEKKISLAKNLEARCRSADPRIKGVRSATLSESYSEVVLIDSNGEPIHFPSTDFSVSLSCRAEENGDSQMGGDYAYSSTLDGLPIEDVAQEAAKTATELLGAGSAPTLKCPAIFRNTVVAELLDFLSSSFCADQIHKGKSLLAGRLEEKIFSEHISLIDDGLLANGAGSRPFDGEGTPVGRTTLVDHGFFANILADHYYAKKMKLDPTASAHRGIKAPPSIGFNNLFLNPGKKTSAELLKGVHRGVLITDLMGIHTANPVTGDFSVGASGILIEDSELTRPMRGFAIAGNILDIFRNVTQVGNDLKFLGNLGAPSIRVSELSVGGT